MADSGGMTSVIDVVLTLAVIGAAEMGLDGAGFTVGEGALWDDVSAWMGLIVGGGGLLHILGHPIHGKCNVYISVRKSETQDQQVETLNEMPKDGQRRGHTINGQMGRIHQHR